MRISNIGFVQRKYILLFVFTIILLGNFLTTKVEAAAYNASDLLGQINQDGTPNWTAGLPNGNIVNTKGLSGPSAVELDSINHRLFVYDNFNNRVLVFNLNTDNTFADYDADYVLGQPDFQTYDAVTTQSGIGGGPVYSSMSAQGSLAYDPVSSRLFVSDMFNRRVLVFNVATSTIANGENADYVLGQTSFTSYDSTTTQSGFAIPYGLTYDSTNSRLFVADTLNCRVMVFNVATSTIANGENADYVLGQTSFTSSISTTTRYSVKDPNDLTYDPANSRLFVSDGNNRRVMVFNVATSTIANGENADYELGQTAGANAFTSSVAATTQSGFADSVVGVAYDSINFRLFVSDGNNHRVMVFNVATSTIANGENADYVLGQTSFTSHNYGFNQGGFFEPVGIVCDSADSRIFVTDVFLNRVMVFNVATSTIANGENADYVLGQIKFDGTVNWTSFGSNNSNNNTVSVGFYNPVGVALDAINHRLFVADLSNNRVLVFGLNSDNTFIDYIPDYELGQAAGDAAFTTAASAATQSGLYGPADLAYDSVSSRLFVVDSNNSRVMVFNVATSTIANGENADYVLGQTNFTSSSSSTTQNRLSYPSGATYDSANTRLFVNDNGNNRVMVFNVATSTIANGENADYELGQAAGDAAFTTAASATTQSGLNYPYSLVYDPISFRLFVSDKSNNRILVFNVATSTMANGKNADYVLGQTSFIASSSATTQSGLYSPAYFAFDPTNNRLFATDLDNNRVLIFNFIKLSSSGLSTSDSIAYSHILSTTGSQGTLSFALTGGFLPDGLSLNPDTGAIYGTATQAGAYSFNITVTDTVSTVAIFSDTQAISMTVYALAPIPTGFNFIRHPLSLDIYVDKFPNDTIGSSGYLFWRTDNSAYNSGWIQTNQWGGANTVEGQAYTYSVKYRNANGIETATTTMGGVSFVRDSGGGGTPTIPQQTTSTSSVQATTTSAISTQISATTTQQGNVSSSSAQVPNLVGLTGQARQVAIQQIRDMITQIQKQLIILIGQLIQALQQELAAMVS
ncbi:MAG: putative Ig domain-containing protein [Candidatus Pacebacteria bacterium]|nr:putative Ig domain-containing protein [Candidatus Paceibacterota bacterium]